MRITGMLIVLLMLAMSASAQDTSSAKPDGTMTRTYPKYPVLVVRNETMNTVRVYDRGFLIANVLPGDSSVTVMPGRGSRSLTLRTLGSETQTEMFAFESNSGWRLTIDHNGNNWLALRPLSREKP